jgi:hypothetical protein
MNIFLQSKRELLKDNLSGDINGIGVFVVVDNDVIVIDGRLPLHYFIDILVNKTELELPI